jgi:peroxiredoxin
MSSKHLILAAVLLLPVTGAVAYEIGDTVADFTLPDLAGAEASLHDQLGKVVVLNFFTTWCEGCNEEAAHLQNDIWQAYPAEDVTVIAVDLQELAPLVQGWAASQGVTYPIWLAPDWTLFTEFPQAIAIPYNAVLDRNMVIRYAAIGFDLVAITAEIDAILDEGQVPATATSWGALRNLYR